MDIILPITFFLAALVAGLLLGRFVRGRFRLASLLVCCAVPLLGWLVGGLIYGYIPPHDEGSGFSFGAGLVMAGLLTLPWAAATVLGWWLAKLVR